MFVLKKIRSLFKKATTPPKPATVIAMSPIMEPAVDRNELNLRLLAAMNAAIEQKRKSSVQQATETIAALTEEYLTTGNEDVPELIALTLKDCGLMNEDFRFEFTDVTPFAAAIEYFHGDLKRAADCICADSWYITDTANTFADLGMEIFYQNIPSRACSIIDSRFEKYIDFEQLGEDIANETQGEFTSYGFFSPTGCEIF